MKSFFVFMFRLILSVIFGAVLFAIGISVDSEVFKAFGGMIFIGGFCWALGAIL